MRVRPRTKPSPHRTRAPRPTEGSGVLWGSRVPLFRTGRSPSEPPAAGPVVSGLGQNGSGPRRSPRLRLRHAQRLLKTCLRSFTCRWRRRDANGSGPEVRIFAAASGACRALCVCARAKPAAGWTDGHRRPSSRPILPHISRFVARVSSQTLPREVDRKTVPRVFSMRMKRHK